MDYDEFIGDWIDKNCPKCGAKMLGNKQGGEWCSFTECDYGCEDAYERLGLYPLEPLVNNDKQG